MRSVPSGLTPRSREAKDKSWLFAAPVRTKIDARLLSESRSNAAVFLAVFARAVVTSR